MDGTTVEGVVVLDDGWITVVGVVDGTTVDETAVKRTAVEGIVISVDGNAVGGIAVEESTIEGVAVEGISVDGVDVDGMMVAGTTLVSGMHMRPVLFTRHGHCVPQANASAIFVRFVLAAKQSDVKLQTPHTRVFKPEVNEAAVTLAPSRLHR